MMAPTANSLSITIVREDSLNNCNHRLEINCLYVETEVIIRSEVHIAKEATQNYREVQNTNSCTTATVFKINHLRTFSYSSDNDYLKITE